MKLIFIFFWLISCGKDNNYNSHYLSKISSNLDSDGDGVSDKDEIKIGRNHLIADIDTNQTIHDNRLTLVDKLHNEYEFELNPKRLIRTELLGLIVGAHKDELSDINQLIFDFNSHHDFWKLYHRGLNFYYFHFISNKYQQYSLPANFNENRRIKINNFSNYGILENVKAATYRLIISTPNEEKIYYLHPSISVNLFLKNQLGAQFQNNILLSLFGNRSNHPTTLSISGSLLNDYRWEYYTNSTQTIETPQVGKTYAFVFGSADEFKQSFLKNGKMNWHEDQSNKFDQRIEKTIFFPSFYKRITTSSDHRSMWDHGSISILCSYTIVNDSGFSPYSPTPEQIISWLNPEVFKESKIIWAQTSSRGTTLRMTSWLSKVEQARMLNPVVDHSNVSVGITRDNCPGGSVSTRSLPLYSDYREFYLAD